MHPTPNTTLINGHWISAAGNKLLAVVNPANGKIIGSVPDMGADEAQMAVEAANRAFHSSQWSNTTAKERAALLMKWFALMESNKQNIAELIVAESGKPMSEALVEITFGNTYAQWFAEEARRIYGEIVASPQPTKQIFITRQPIGVAALITPWNFPHATLVRKVAPAIAAGCTVVIKPAEDTPMTSLVLAKLAEEAGIPIGVINVVTCSRQNAAAVGNVFCTSPLVAGISFTGSTEVGRILYEKCATRIKRLALELGGNASFIVFKSADIDNAIVGAMAAKFRNCGQACIAANRFLIHEDVYDEFLSKITAAVKNLRVGDGIDSNVHIGPIINEAQFRKISSIVDDAVTKGANVIIGARTLPSLGKLYYEPTILTDVTDSMRAYGEEIFGPIISIMKFTTEDEAIRIANDTRRGLAGYFYSQDLNQIFRVARKLEVGMVGINDGTISTVEGAFGGVKESGLGREGSSHGIDEYVEFKYISLGNLGG